MIERIGTGTRMSQIVKHGNVAYLAGQVGGGTSVEAQTRDCLGRIETLLEKAGSSPERILQAVVWLADMNDFAEMNAVWDAWVPEGHAPEPVHILELFAANINKWAAIEWYLRLHDIDPMRVAAIGDQVNDVPMMEHAGIGVAVGNAIDQVKAHAAYVTADNQNHGVARAIDAILSGDLSAIRA